MASSMMKYFFLSLCLTSGTVSGFSSLPSIISWPQSLSAPIDDSVLVLFGKNSKKGRLGGLVEEAGATVVPSAPRSRSSSSAGAASSKQKKNKAGDVSGEIAPGLAEWMSKQDGSEMKETEVVVERSSTNKKGKIKSSDRRAKQSIRKEQDEERTAKIEAAIKTLEETFEENGNLEGIIAAVRGLVQLGDGNSVGLKSLLNSKARSDYRLAWVGGDDAICHLGTGLHKVPLARLQEVFLTFMGRNRIEVSEVIRILGPFPNVRNILQGSTKVGAAKGSEVESMNIVMDSMVDGTGKEILAGTEDNIRRVNFQIYFSDEKAIVAVVPPDNTSDSPVRSDPLEDYGAHVLVFIREDELDDKLDELRVS